jgi:hypothetical protein
MLDIADRFSETGKGRVVRLSDSAVFLSASHAARATGGTDTGISKAILKGYRHREDQFMLHDEWLKAGKPSRHPRRREKGERETIPRGGQNPNARRVVRLSDGKIFDSMTEAAIEINGTSSGISKGISRGMAHRGHRFRYYDD